MTLQQAKSIARHLGLTLRQVRSGAYRVNFRDGNETTAYYTDNLEDAVNTAVEMARTRDVVQAVDETVATERVPFSPRCATTLQPVRPTDDWCGSNSALLRCPLKCPVCPKADTGGRFMSTGPRRRRRARAPFRSHNKREPRPACECHGRGLGNPYSEHGLKR
jgi:hypothetical protein